MHCFFGTDWGLASAWWFECFISQVLRRWFRIGTPLRYTEGSSFDWGWIGLTLRWRFNTMLMVFGCRVDGKRWLISSQVLSFAVWIDNSSTIADLQEATVEHIFVPQNISKWFSKPSGWLPAIETCTCFLESSRVWNLGHPCYPFLLNIHGNQNTDPF